MEDKQLKDQKTEEPTNKAEETAKVDEASRLSEPGEVSSKSTEPQTRGDGEKGIPAHDRSKAKPSENVRGDLEPAGPRADKEPVKPSKSDHPNAKWYVVHTYSGHENKVAATLKQRIESENLEEKILDVLVPMQDKIEIKSGKKTTVKEKIFPGYILVKMILDDSSWLAVRTTPGVTSFVGIGNKPTPISDQEVQTIVKFTQQEAPIYKQVFAPDDTVKIVDGPFAEFIGKVDSVDEEKGKVKVLVSIFGRETPVELDFLQVQKI